MGLPRFLHRLAGLWSQEFRAQGDELVEPFQSEAFMWPCYEKGNNGQWQKKHMSIF